MTIWNILAAGGALVSLGLTIYFPWGCQHCETIGDAALQGMFDCLRIAVFGLCLSGALS